MILSFRHFLGTWPPTGSWPGSDFSYGLLKLSITKWDVILFSPFRARVPPTRQVTPAPVLFPRQLLPLPARPPWPPDRCVPQRRLVFCFGSDFLPPSPSLYWPLKLWPITEYWLWPTDRPVLSSWRWRCSHYFTSRLTPQLPLWQEDNNRLLWGLHG